jgi:hypothetical protein
MGAACVFVLHDVAHDNHGFPSFPTRCRMFRASRVQPAYHPAFRTCSRQACIGEGRMRYRARVYLQPPHAKSAIDLGEKDLSALPVVGDHISFEHQGKVESGRVDHVEGHSGVVPKVHIVQTSSE